MAQKFNRWLPPRSYTYTRAQIRNFHVGSMEEGDFVNFYLRLRHGCYPVDLRLDPGRSGGVGVLAIVLNARVQIDAAETADGWGHQDSFTIAVVRRGSKRLIKLLKDLIQRCETDLPPEESTTLAPPQIPGREARSIVLR